jgi:hypothetical protein
MLVVLPEQIVEESGKRVMIGAGVVNNVAVSFLLQ